MRSRALLNVLFLASTFVAATFSSIAIAQPPGGGRGMMGGMMGGGMGRGGMGGIASLLLIPEVVDHLKLDETQKNELKEVQQSMMDEMRKLFEGMRPAGGGGDAGGGRQGGGGRGGFGEMTDEMRKRMEENSKKTEEISKKTEEKISEILDPTQFDRLIGLYAQQNLFQAIRHRLIAEKMKAANCPVTEDQETKLKEVEVAAGAKMLELGFNPENRTKRLEIRKESEEKALGVFNDTQKKTFEEIKGEKFEFPAPTQFGRGGDRGGDRRPN
jgi:hypothetical protein